MNARCGQAFGLYTALTSDSNIPVDFIDEDGLTAEALATRSALSE